MTTQSIGTGVSVRALEPAAMAFVIGMLFGYPVAVGVTLIAIWSGALFGVGLILLQRATMQTALPFGSFWTAAAVLAMLLPGPVSFLSGLFTPLL